jgi:hypothetical protein
MPSSNRFDSQSLCKRAASAAKSAIRSALGPPGTLRLTLTSRPPGARPRRSGHPARPRRRGDRVSDCHLFQRDRFIRATDCSECWLVHGPNSKLVRCAAHEFKSRRGTLIGMFLRRAEFGDLRARGIVSAIREGRNHAAARGHHDAGRRGGGLAARGARAGGHAGGWLSQCRFTRTCLRTLWVRFAWA